MTLLALVKRDVGLAIRSSGGAGLAVIFFTLVIALVPLGVGPELGILRTIAPGIIWIAALLAVLLTLDRMFQADAEDGSLDIMLVSGPLPALLVLAKVFAHWLTTGLPLTLIAPVLAVTLNLSPESYGPLILSLLLGTPALSLIGAIGAALTLDLRRGGLLLSLLTLPLYVPVLIFGAISVETPQTVTILAGLSGLSLLVSPIAAAAALRLNRS